MKGKKADDVDLASLPPIISLLASIRFDCRKNTATKLTDLLKNYTRSFQKNLTREDIVQAAIEKGFYIDPSQGQEKKKDTKIVSEASTELNPLVYGKSINALLGDLILQAKKNKKDILDGKNIVIDPKAKIDPKKDPKGSKKDTKQVVVEQVIEDKPREKEYIKNFEQLFLLFDFPNNGEELDQLNQVNSQYNLVLVVKEKITNWGGVDMGLLNQPGDFEGDLKDRMNDFIEQEEDLQATEQMIPKVQRSMSTRSKEFSQQERDAVKAIRQQRAISDRANGLRNLYIKEVVMELDMDIEEETIKQFAEIIIEEFCQFSLDQQQYLEWGQSKKDQPLVTKQGQPDQFELEILRLQQINIKRIEDEKLLLEQQQLNEAAVQKKGAKKEVKKTEEDIQKERQALEDKKKEEEQRHALIEKALAQQKKMKEKNHLQFYRKQFCNIDSQKLGTGILLEVLLDQLEAEKQQIQSGQPAISLDDKEDASRVQSVLEYLDYFVEGKNIPTSVLATINSFQNTSQQLEQKSSVYKIIVDEADEIEKRSYGQKLYDDQSVPNREREILNNMCFPGIDRYQMPELPEKSENLRKAEKSKLSPFIKVDIYEFERRQMIIKFEEVLKEAEQEQEWYFGDRIYLERHNRNTLSQTIYKALLYDPHILTRYNEKDDNMLLALYFRNPPGRLLRKKWSAEWRVLPNLENWINFFKANDTNIKNDFYYDIDYQQIGNFHERSKIMFPTDNSLILATKYTIGDKENLRYKVVKEGVVFGLLEDKDQNTIFWANFDEGIKLTVQQYNEEQKQEVNPDDEVIPQKINLKACFNLTLPNGLILRFLSTGDVVQKYQEVKKFQCDNQQNMLNLYNNAEMNHECETKRTITGQGSVIKYMKDGSIVILYANGNTSIQTRNDTWITTNNKGLRKARRMKDGAEWALESIPCAIRKDPDSGSLIYIRDDQMMVIKYQDGSQYTQHQDGTKMLVSATQDSVIVEHINFCTVRVSLDRVKARTDTIIGLGSTYANVGFENIFERSNDGRVVETWLGDGGRVVAYREKQELPSYKEYKTNTIHLLYMKDGAVTKIVDDGEIALITAQERMQLNKKGENNQNGLDINYWLELFSVPDERKSGVFTAFLDQKTLWTRDEESNFFSISSTGEVVAKISVSLQQNQNQVDERPSTPDIPDGDYVEEENKFLPPPTSWIPPRLFVINNDNTGQEFLNDEQLQNYFGIKNKDPLCTQVIDNSVPGILTCTSISFITQIIELQQKKINYIQAHIPQTLDIVPKTINKQDIPLFKVYTFRNVLKFHPFDKEARTLHFQELEKYEVWKRDQQKTQYEFGVLQKTEDENYAEFNIQLRILEGRRNDYPSESYDQCKNKQFQLLERQSIVSLQEDKSQLVEQVTQNRHPKGEINEVKQALRDMQKKASFGPNMPSQKKIVVTTDNKVNGFVMHYFQTLEGIKATQSFPAEIFNIQPKNKPKIMTEQEYSQYARTITNQTVKEDVEINQSIKDVQSLQPLNQLEAQYMSGTRQLKPIILKVSVFTQAEIDDEIKDQKKQQQVDSYISKKRKDYNVYGSERNKNQIKNVPCLLRTNPKSELNQKYILTDSLTDNRMKISSMATRVYQQAPSINDMRNEGMHQTIIKTLDKKNNLDEMIDQRNLMINAELNDQLRRDLTIMPIVIRFGNLKQGGLYQVKVQVKNEDVLAQRIVIKQPQTKFVKVFMKQMGLISLGLIREIWVQIDAQQEIFGKFLDEFQIVSKHQIYTIPIHALILDSQQYERLNQDYRKINKRSLQKNYVQELRFDQNNMNDHIDSQNSDLLPKINYDKNYKIDPYSSKNVKKEQEMSQEEDQ